VADEDGDERDDDVGIDDYGDDDITNILPSFKLSQRNCAVHLLKLLLLIPLQQVSSTTNRYYLQTSATIPVDHHWNIN